jgi:hypothetical protein
MGQELLPCVCGGEAELQEMVGHDSFNADFRQHQVVCLACGRAGPRIDGCGMNYMGAPLIHAKEAEAREGWNQRQPTPKAALQEGEQALRYALEAEDCEIVVRSVVGPTNEEAFQRVAARLSARPALPDDVGELAKQIVDRTIQRLRDLHDYAARPAWDEVIAEELSDALEAFAAHQEELKAALKPFATLGGMLDGPFAPALFKDEDSAGIGAAWRENDEPRFVTFGDLRRARKALRPDPPRGDKPEVGL